MPASKSLEAFQKAWDEDRFDDVRVLFRDLGDEERELLAAELGSDVVRALDDNARRALRAARAPKRGRVIVVNGIMGAELDVARKGKSENLWIALWAIMRGRFGQLELDESGRRQADSATEIEVAGLHKGTYMPLVLELDTQWHVKKFGFDWRLDIGTSAERLAEVVSKWGQGEPVHIVAHSMGGLVARLFTKRFTQLWRSMQDETGAGRGGRLVMLGTPNRGSFEIPQVLTGENGNVKKLALADVVHSKRGLVKIISTFPGCYQMLPSPLVDLGDAHGALYDSTSWGDWKAPRRHLEAARRFHDEMHAIVDPERLTYVAGYDQETLCRVRIDAPGRFSFRTTRSGDGSVSHELGLLEGVSTYWVDESHGNLPKTKRVLGGIHELLATGRTGHLESTPPVRRGFERDAGWIAASDVYVVPQELEETLAPVRSAKRRGAAPAELPPIAARAVEAEIAAGFLAVPEREPESSLGASSEQEAPPKLRVEVVCADIRQTRADAYCVGHYVDVSPSNAEFALDRAVTFTRAELQRQEADEEAVDEERLVLTALTRRGVLRGDLGEINLYPWADARDAKKVVAVAGMGHPGAFSEGKLRRLARSLAWTLGSLPSARTIATVLIGSGNGGLPIKEALRGLLSGLADAVGSGLRGGVEKVRIVEMDLVKAQRVHAALDELLAGETDERVDFRLRKGVVEEETGAVPDTLGWMLFLSAAADAAKARANTAGHKAALTLRDRVSTDGGRRRRAWESLDKLSNLLQNDASLLSQFAEALGQVDWWSARRGGGARPLRMSFLVDDGYVHAAAINDSAVVPERQVCDAAIAAELARRTLEPYASDLKQLGKLLHRRLIPAEFRSALANSVPVVLEVDRDLAPISWELLAYEPEGDPDPLHIGLRSPVARQLRTSYSPPPETVSDPRTPLRALVIGDPGDPEVGDDLPGARREAQAVARILRAAGVQTVSRIGAPRDGDPPFEDERGPASRLEILRLLDEGHFDLLHYSGHGDFDPEDPTRTGWVFKDGLFTAAELASVDRMPRLVIANACLSARTSLRLAGGGAAARGREQGLLPSLADQFLRQGVHNYVGTAWEVDDAGAVLFAETLYRTLLGVPIEGARLAGQTIELGRALLAARKGLARDAGDYGSLWVAYQHYGDPTFQL